MAVQNVVVNNVTVIGPSWAKTAANLLVLQPYFAKTQQFNSNRYIQVENTARIHSWKGTLTVLAQTTALTADILIGNDTTGWGDWTPESYIQPWKFNSVVRDSFPSYNPNTDVPRWPMAKQVFEPEVFLKPWTFNNVVINGFNPYNPGHDVQRQKQAQQWLDYQEYPQNWHVTTLITNQINPVFVPVPNPPCVSAWTADSGQVTADSINFTCDGADLVNNGGIAISENETGPHTNRLAYSASAPLFVVPYKNNDGGT
jgi:hypothetical protein